MQFTFRSRECGYQGSHFNINFHASVSVVRFEHQDSEELKEGAAAIAQAQIQKQPSKTCRNQEAQDFMGKLKDLWNKNADEDMMLGGASAANA